MPGAVSTVTTVKISTMSTSTIVGTADRYLRSRANAAAVLVGDSLERSDTV